MNAPSAEHLRKLEHMYLTAPINALFHPEIRIDAGAAEVRIPVRPELFHAAGAAHGAVFFKAADDAAFFAAASLVDDFFVVTSHLDLHLLRPMTTGTVVARARVVHQGRKSLLAEAVLTDSDGRQVGRATGTFVRSRLRIAEVPGYRLAEG